MRDYYVYIMSNKRNTVYYVGVTNNLERRVAEHKSQIQPGFTKMYNCNKLVYFEAGSSAAEAIAREKQLKNWHREWKLNLIHEHNPGMVDLSDEILK